MSICKLCNQSLGYTEKRFSSTQLQIAFQFGLRPGKFESVVHEVGGPALSAQDRELLGAASDWTVCLICATKVDICLFRSSLMDRSETKHAPASTFDEEQAMPETKEKIASDAQLSPPRRSISIEQHMDELSAPHLPKLLKPSEVNFTQLSTLRDTDLDRLAFGAITVDLDGKVLFYNEWQSRFAGLPRYLVLNRNFFGEVAPCARAAAFEGRFREYVKDYKSTAQPSRVLMFDYVFTFVRYEYVKIVFAPARVFGTINILVFKQSYEKFKSPRELYQAVELGALKKMSDEELNMMSYGVITLDRSDRVAAFNDWESQLAGIPKHRALHNHWFKEVAPCTRVADFEGRYRAFRAGNAKPEMFEFIFPFSNGAQFVNCLFLPAREDKSINIVVFKRKLII